MESFLSSHLGGLQSASMLKQILQMVPNGSLVLDSQALGTLCINLTVNNARRYCPTVCSLRLGLDSAREDIYFTLVMKKCNLRIGEAARLFLLLAPSTAASRAACFFLLY